jgi:hypothetical protein
LTSREEHTLRVFEENIWTEEELKNRRLDKTTS